MSPTHPDFLLSTPLAAELFHQVAGGLPVIDYHCHLDPAALATDRSYADLDALCVAEDPYKHRLMRIDGAVEAGITGPGADPHARFLRWAATLPGAVGSPLHHWSALELARLFGIAEPLAPASAERIWEQARDRLARPGHGARGLLTRLGAACVVTSDRLLDDLAHHAALAACRAPRVLPSLRGDDLAAVGEPVWAEWCGRLAAATGLAVRDLASWRAAVERRLDHFAAHGCRVADHALDDCAFVPVDEAVLDALLRRRLAGEALAGGDLVRLRSGLLAWMGGAYARRGWLWLLHLGAQRRTSPRLRRLAGPAGGYAGIAGPTDLGGLTALLAACEEAGGLPRTVLFPLNPADWAAAAVLTGSFAADGVRGLVQFGPAWWWDDHAPGIRAHLDLLAGHGLLGAFPGMCTDARTVPSQVRHEYFRRLLCDWLGRQAAQGLAPGDRASLDPLVRALCHGNAADLILGERS